MHYMENVLISHPYVDFILCIFFPIKTRRTRIVKIVHLQVRCQMVIGQLPHSLDSKMHTYNKLLIRGCPSP